jgi:hypothetical protein
MTAVCHSSVRQIIAARKYKDKNDRNKYPTNFSEKAASFHKSEAAITGNYTRHNLIF